jgi:chaperone BCS1
MIPNWETVVEYVKNELATNQFFSAAAFASILTAIIMSLKGVPGSIWGRIKKIITYRVVIYQTDDLYLYLTEWLNENYKSKVRNVEAFTKSPTGDSDFYEESEDLVKNRKVIEMPVDDYFYIWNNFRLIKISYGKEKFENASSLKSAYLRNYTFSGFFASRAIRGIVNKINEDYNKKKKIPYTFQTENSSYFTRISPVKGKKISDVILNSEVKIKIMTDISNWWNSIDDYKKRGIPYKRGHCYYGPPGTGKTTLVKSIANEYGFNVYNVNLKKIDDDSLIYLLREVEFGSILLFEDIDSIYNGRENLLKTGTTFTGFLNALDGIVELDGVLVIITTNHIEKMDPALLRGGRMDIKIEIGHSSRPEIINYLMGFYPNFTGTFDALKEGNLPMVDVQNSCMENKNLPQKALERINEILENQNRKIK